MALVEGMAGLAGEGGQVGGQGLAGSRGGKGPPCTARAGRPRVTPELNSCYCSGTATQGGGTVRASRDSAATKGVRRCCFW